MATILVSSYGDGSAAKVNFESAYAAASTGDTIQFPLSGSATWSATATVSKALTIDGNGTTLTQGATLNNGFFNISNFTSAVLMRITGFTLDVVNHTAAGNAIRVTNCGLDNIRIDNNTFHYGYEAIAIGGARGVIDHNTFYNPLKGISFTAGSRDQANESWVSMAAGTAEALFVEDNSFIYNASYPSAFSQESVGTYNGGKLVVRYNTWNSAAYPLALTITPIEAHGNASGGASTSYWQEDYGGANQARRGQSVIEVYENTISGKRFDYLAIFRGSALLVYNNNISHTDVGYESVINLWEEEDDSWDSPFRTAWPAEDQIHNSFIWGNTFNGTPQVSGNVTARGTEFIVLNRDYFLHAPEATGGYEYFTGLNGASNTSPTNGVIFPTYGTMVFSASGANAYYGYVPYTYPHPLTGPFFTFKRLGRRLKLKGLSY